MKVVVWSALDLELQHSYQTKLICPNNSKYNITDLKQTNKVYNKVVFRSVLLGVIILNIAALVVFFVLPTNFCFALLF